MRGEEEREHVRYLAERLNHANKAGRVEVELAEALLRALRGFVAGPDPRRRVMAEAALDALDRQATITRAVLDDHRARAVVAYLALPAPYVAPRAAAEVAQEDDEDDEDAPTAHHAQGRGHQSRAARVTLRVTPDIDKP